MHMSIMAQLLAALLVMSVLVLAALRELDAGGQH
jgi:hypothetical protein